MISAYLGCGGNLSSVRLISMEGESAALGLYFPHPADRAHPAHPREHAVFLFFRVLTIAAETAASRARTRKATIIVPKLADKNSIIESPCSGGSQRSGVGLVFVLSEKKPDNSREQDKGGYGSGSDAAPGKECAELIYQQ